MKFKYIIKNKINGKYFKALINAFEVEWTDKQSLATKFKTREEAELLKINKSKIIKLLSLNNNLLKPKINTVFIYKNIPHIITLVMIIFLMILY